MSFAGGIMQVIVNHETTPADHTDPVCGIQVDEQQAAETAEYLGKTYYFCSEGCRRKFEQRPEQYVVRAGFQQPGGAGGF